MPHGRVGAVRARLHQAGEGILVRRVQRRMQVGRGRGQPAAVDQRAREGLGARQLQHRIAVAQADRGSWA